MLRPNGAQLYRVLQVVYTVVTPGRFGPPNPETERTEVAVSGDDLRQTKRVDAVASLQLLLKRNLTAAIAACPDQKDLTRILDYKLYYLRYLKLGALIFQHFISTKISNKKGHLSSVKIGK